MAAAAFFCAWPTNISCTRFGGGATEDSRDDTGAALSFAGSLVLFIGAPLSWSINFFCSSFGAKPPTTPEAGSLPSKTSTASDDAETGTETISLGEASVAGVSNISTISEA